jgi:hypothetical protein
VQLPQDEEESAVTTVERKTLRAAALFAALLALAGVIDNPEDHGPMKPGPNAPAYVNWRTGELVDPNG